MANVILVHGAWADGSSWQAVVATLHNVGHCVTAVQLPLTSLDDDIAWTKRAIAEIDGPVTLVGHSYGGSVISGAAVGSAQVDGLMFVAAYAPDDSETILALTDRGAVTPGSSAIRLSVDEWTTIDPARFGDALAADVPVATAHVLAAVQKPTNSACFSNPSGRGAWHELPCAYLVSLDDQILDPPRQQWFAAGVGATVTELRSSHLSPVSHPEDVAAAIGRLLSTVARNEHS